MLSTIPNGSNANYCDSPPPPLYDALIPDVFTVVATLAPVAMYFAIHALIRLTGRALMLTTAGDVMFLSLAVVGAVAVGPAQLFFPTGAALFFGNKVWLMLLLLYGLFASLVSLMQKPGLVIYGRTPRQVHETLVQACHAIDPAAVAEGQRGVHLPTSGWRLHVDRIGARDAVAVTSMQAVASPEIWYRILSEMRSIGIKHESGRRRGWIEALVATGLVALIAVMAAAQTATMKEEFWAWLNH